ncbi:MAG: fluoride efflux transporter CrcB [Micavibrio aeruginosavorus]|uniref:Fluoride-specific ion channel FluC n=1 Tax=Micavibrio aeruginosavorus TaxID=349221 RepID=A0A7T5UH90_9BACT|nr:MAG: fluoride efflux transporter CrcB [Micavibrio aeruginosavorus]
MINLVAIAAGGAIGALLRHGVNHFSAGASFPWGTMVVNIGGSLAMGLLIGMFALFLDVPPVLRAFMTVGLLGAFTTFSTFSMDAILLLEKGRFLEGTFYILGSVGLSLLAMVLGLIIARMIPL